eukprot:CAMPEP_0171262514 /NCGR_PEP_ID=MMETSP0790-20130122/56599_1 /TAXON_ID=2925 /ORGANISM="Alexandrium catenella, Strain OF101" /LENGTH=161 /DNA_ID=CAMNT_0011731055 /DNA_START=17 /DNA_END=500 /DNA_ORIENTATION=-
MAAAAVGNTISDVVGLWVSGCVEAGASHLGLPDHGLTNAQRRLVRIRVLKNCSMVVGLVIGCIIGMFPLVYPDSWRLWEARKPTDKPDSEVQANWSSRDKRVWGSTLPKQRSGGHASATGAPSDRSAAVHCLARLKSPSAILGGRDGYSNVSEVTGAPAHA